MPRLLFLASARHWPSKQVLVISYGSRSYFGYSVTHHHRPRLKVAAESLRRFKAALRQAFRAGRGRNLRRLLADLAPVLRGWVAYFRLAEVTGVFEELDQWIRRKLRSILWRQWKRRWTRFKELCRRGLEAARAAVSISNGRGPWWNAGAGHMNQAVPARWFSQRGLVSLVHEYRRLKCSA